MLDRLDLQIEVSALTSDELLGAAPGEPNAAVRERVLAARERQAARGGLDALLANAAFREHCALDATARRLVADSVDRGGMSARAVHRALRVARMIADLAEESRASARCGSVRRCTTAPTRRDGSWPGKRRPRAGPEQGHREARDGSFARRSRARGLRPAFGHGPPRS